MQNVDMNLETIANTRPGKVPYGLPQPVVDVAKQWCKIADGKTPHWHEVNMSAFGEAMPHMTVLHKTKDGRFTFEFFGSAVAAMVGQDMTGETVAASDANDADINWAQRVKPVLADGEMHLQKGVADSQYASSIDFIALDMPILSADNDEIEYIVSCTAPEV